MLPNHKTNAAHAKAQMQTRRLPSLVISLGGANGASEPTFSVARCAGGVPESRLDALTDAAVLTHVQRFLQEAGVR